jgi:hypothetical protein
MAAAAAGSSAAAGGPLELYRAPDPTGIFELVDLLGEGSYGSVYKGRHIRTGEIVAVKVIELVEEELAEIWAEINFLRICKHPNIVKYFGTYLRQDKLWVRGRRRGGSPADAPAARDGDLPGRLGHGPVQGPGARP